MSLWCSSLFSACGLCPFVNPQTLQILPCTRHFHRTCGDTTVGLTTKMYCLMGKQIRSWSKWLPKTKVTWLLFWKSCEHWGALGLAGNLGCHYWATVLYLRAFLQCKVERWRKETPELHTMLQNTHISPAHISGGVPRQADTNPDSQMCNSDQTKTKIDCGLQLLATINKAYQRIPQNTLSL